MDKNNLEILHANSKIISSDMTDDASKDYFKKKDGISYAGTHLIVEAIGAQNLDNKTLIEKMFVDSIKASGATLLHMHLHQFNPNGLSGIAVLAESHISIHTWPEKGYAALDIFMCGEADPYACIPVIQEALTPTQLDVEEILRGRSDKYKI